MNDTLFAVLKGRILEKHPQETLEVFLQGRLIQENRIRQTKRRGQPCPFSQNGICNRIDIRCGERQQFACPETEKDRARPHRCNYRPDPAIHEYGILIVEEESYLRELYRQKFITCGAAPERIEEAETVAKARELLLKARFDSRAYAVILSGVRFKKESGVDLVSYLAERNYNSRILLVSGYYRVEDLPRTYVGDYEIVPGRKVVTAFMQKPVPLREFTANVDRIKSEFRPD